MKSVETDSKLSLTGSFDSERPRHDDILVLNKIEVLGSIVQDTHFI
jgi:hypothetical protein